MAVKAVLVSGFGVANVSSKNFGKFSGEISYKQRNVVAWMTGKDKTTGKFRLPEARKFLGMADNESLVWDKNTWTPAMHFKAKECIDKYYVPNTTQTAKF